MKYAFMKKFLFLSLFLPLSAFAYSIGSGVGDCQFDIKTGNYFCHQNQAERYRSGFVPYTRYINPQYQSDYITSKQVCPLHSHYERYPVDGCVCNTGYIKSKHGNYCTKEKKDLSNEAFNVLWKALQKKELTIHERNKRGEIIQWVNETFNYNYQ